MKQWTVTYRDRSGVKTSVVIEAEDRAGVFAELKTRGINAISITEGVVKAPRRAASGGGVSKGVWGVVAAVVVAAVVGVVWMVMQGEEASVEVKKVEKKEVVQEEKGLEIATSNVVENAKTNDVVRTTFSESKGVLIHCSTNANGVVTERYRTPDGKTHRRVIPPPPIFTNASEQVIAMVIGSRAGQRIPPLPPMRPGQLDEAFVKSLQNPITVSKDDTPEVAALKIAVQSLKHEIDDALKTGDGRGVAQILQDHVDQVNFNATLRGEAVNQYQSLIKEGNADGADVYLERVNEKLIEYGIEPIKKQ